MPNALRILIPDKSMKRVIGTSKCSPGACGENVRRVGNESSTFIHVSSKPFNTKDACTDHIVSISPRAPDSDPGSMNSDNCDRKWKHAIDQCSYAMMSVLREAFQTLDARCPFKCILLAPAHCAGLIIGSRGDRVGHVRRAFNVDIQLNKYGETRCWSHHNKPPPDQYDEEVTFCGKLEDVARVVNMMNDVFQIYWPNVPEEEQRAAQIAQARLDKEGERRRGYQNQDGGGSYHDLKNYRDRVAHDRDARRSGGAVEGPSPGVVSELALLGKTGFFVRVLILYLICLQYVADLRARVESGGLGFIEDVSMEDNDVVVRATEGVLPYVIAQIMDRIRNVENEC
eukprot:g60.t1